jgi:hypothetical protein
MPGLLLHVNAVAQCTHGAKATIAPSQPRVLVSGQPVATMVSLIGVVGCPFQIPVGAGTKPQPCVTVKWAMPSTRFLVSGQPAALLPAPGPGPAACLSIEQIPQGPPIVSTVQIRVIGT